MNKFSLGCAIFLVCFLFANDAIAKVFNISKAETVMCGIENCHGVDVICGPKPAQMCTMMYAVGDGCRQYAKCEIIDGKCQLRPDPRFEECQICIKKCLEGLENDPAASFGCESQCLPVDNGR
ncbi:MAG: hypothetical protein IT395_04830 [Candidatus Omnitrophica bacterium]|nr:hypothetical protein [Candidatus Omnitrophota bacterium]